MAAAMVAALLAEPEPTPDIGKCTQCACDDYQLQPFEISAETFLHEVRVTSRRGAGGRGPDGRHEIPVREIDERTSAFTSGRRNVVLRKEDGDFVRLYRGKTVPAAHKKPLKTFRIGHSTTGEVVIAIRAALGSTRGDTDK